MVVSGVCAALNCRLHCSGLHFACASCVLAVLLYGGTPYRDPVAVQCLCVCVCVQTNIDLGEEERKDEEKGSREEERKDYNMGVLRQVQVIFGHLASSKLQYFVPRGFWKHFKSVVLCLFRLFQDYIFFSSVIV